jgi:hypothetical protein
VVNVAIPALRLPLPNWLGPSKNVTLPVAVLGNTVAWNVRLWPAVDGLVPEVRLRVVVVVVGAAETLMVRLALTATCAGALLSSTCTVKVELPVVLGVPVMEPVEGFNERAGEPGGSEPEEIEYVYGATPPDPEQESE